MKRITSYSIIILLILCNSCKDEVKVVKKKTINDYTGVYTMNCQKSNNYTGDQSVTNYQTQLELLVEDDNPWVIESTSGTNTPIFNIPAPVVDNELNYEQHNGIYYHYYLKIDLITDSVFIDKVVQYNSGRTIWSFKGKMN